MDDATLLAEIAAHPADDERRLVYADRLSDRGDPRGEFIHLQIRSKRGGYEPATEARLRALKQHETDWKRDAGLSGTLTNFERGFPSSLIGNARNIVASRQALATQPIVSLSILTDFTGIEELCALPELKRLHTLCLGATMGSYGRAIALEPEQVLAIASSPQLHGVRTLEIQKGALTAETASLLAGAAWFPLLEHVSMPDNVLGEGAVTIFSRLRHARWLWFSGCDLGPDAVRALANSHVRHLEMLGLPNTQLDDASLQALASSQVLATVTRLELEWSGVKDDGVVALATSPFVAALTTLNLKRNALGARAAAALGASTALRALSELDVRDNLFEKAGVEAFVQGRGLPSLRKLGLTGNGVKTGRFVTWESGSEAAGDFSSGTTEVEETAGELRLRFVDRPGLAIV